MSAKTTTIGAMATTTQVPRALGFDTGQKSGKSKLVSAHWPSAVRSSGLLSNLCNNHTVVACF